MIGYGHRVSIMYAHVGAYVVCAHKRELGSSEKNVPATLKHSCTGSVCIRGIWLVYSFHLIREFSVQFLMSSQL